MGNYSVEIKTPDTTYIRKEKPDQQKSLVSRQPLELTKNGSIHTAKNPEALLTQPSVKNTGRTKSPLSKNGSAFSGQINFITNRQEKTAQASSNLNSLTATLEMTPEVPEQKYSVADATAGRQQAIELQNNIEELRGKVDALKSHDSQAQKINTDSQNLQKAILNADKDFQKKQKANEAKLRDLEDQRRAIMEEMIAANEDLDKMNKELEAELASGSNNTDKIMSLRAAIRDKSSTITVNGNKINILGQSTKSLMNQMNLDSKSYISMNKSYQSNLASNQTQLEQTLEVATNVEGIATLVEMSGTAVENLGRLFKTCAAVPIAGTALVAAGMFMEPIGTTGKTVGQLGKTAALATQSIAFASEGMLQQAFSAAMMAVQTGSFAADSTKSVMNDWKGLDAELKSVTAKTEDLAAKAHQITDKADGISKAGDNTSTSGNKKEGGFFANLFSGKGLAYMGQSFNSVGAFLSPSFLSEQSLSQENNNYSGYQISDQALNIMADVNTSRYQSIPGMYSLRAF